MCHFNGRRRNYADLKHEEVGGPPGQEDDLLVGEGGVHHRAGDKLRIEDGDDLACNAREHPSGDVVRANCCRLDELGVALRIELFDDTIVFRNKRQGDITGPMKEDGCITDSPDTPDLFSQFYPISDNSLPIQYLTTSSQAV